MYRSKLLIDIPCLERQDRLSDLLERYRSLKRETRQPTASCSLVGVVPFGGHEGDDPQRVRELDIGELGGLGADDREVAGGEGSLEAGVWRALACHEQMFACLAS